MAVFASKTFVGGAAMAKKHNVPIICCRSSSLNMRRKKDNLYKVLSLESESVGADEIKKAYRSMARKYHPDVCAPSRKEESTRMFVELRRAYETLSDPVSRRRYDSDRMSLCQSENDLSRHTLEAQLCELLRRSDRREKARSASRRA